MRVIGKRLCWFDHLVDQQQLVLSSQGDTAGYWGDLSPEGNNLSRRHGTAAHGLARAIRYTDGQQRGRYLQTLRRFGTFIRWGSCDDQQGKNRGGFAGWILADGENRGAIGCGYYRGELSLSPYSISTSVAGAGFFSALAVSPAILPIGWSLRMRFVGCWHNRRGRRNPLHPAQQQARRMRGYHELFCDGMVAVYLRADLIRCAVLSPRRSNPESVAAQKSKAQRVWGKMRSEDQQRSQGASICSPGTITTSNRIKKCCAPSTTT
jgi:hypothetical protein